MITAYITATTAKELAELLKGKQPDKLIVTDERSLFVRKLYSTEYVPAEEYFRELQATAEKRN